MHLPQHPHAVIEVAIIPLPDTRGQARAGDTLAVHRCMQARPKAHDQRHARPGDQHLRCGARSAGRSARERTAARTEAASEQQMVTERVLNVAEFKDHLEHLARVRGWLVGGTDIVPA
ncbi:hypothetical protein GCM10019017_00120 [Streptomyces showdoensis]